MSPIVSQINRTAEAPVTATAATPARRRRASKDDTARRTQTSKKEDGAPTPSRRRVRVAEGIYKDRHGLAATVKVNGVQREIRFPASTSLKIIRARRDELRASLRTLPDGDRHTLNHDAGRYLDQVQHTLRVSLRDRRRDLAVWLPRFGHLRTLALPSHLANLNAQLHEWRRTLAASSCNHRRHALIHLVRLLYGRRAAIDLIDLVRFPPAPPKPRWGAAHAHRCGPRAPDTRLEDTGSVGVDALDGHAALTNGPSDSRRLPPAGAHPVRVRPAREARASGRRAAGGRGGRGGTRVH